MDVLAFLTLDIQRPNISAIVYGMQGDRQSRAIRAQLVDGSTQWTPPAGTFFVISYAKPDGTRGMYSQTETGNAAVTVSGSVATIELAEQVLTVAGDVPMTLTMFNADGERLSAFTWLLIVKPAAYSDAAFMSTDYYNLLTEQITAVLKTQENITGLTATATTLAPGSAATVTVTGGTGAGDPFNFEIGIPRGNTGAQGKTGAAAEITAQIVEYQSGTSGTTAPTGAWSTTVPTVPAGQYLWTRSTITFNSGSPVVSYSVSRMGIDGTGIGDMTKTVYDPTRAIEAAGGIAAYVGETTTSNPNLLDNWWFKSNVINQKERSSYSGDPAYAMDRWRRTNNRTEVYITSNGVRVATPSTATGVAYLAQYIPFAKLIDGVGKIVTISVLFDDGHIETATGTYNGSSTTSITTKEYHNCRCYFQYTNALFSDGMIFLIQVGYPSASATILAVKLEYGGISTLAADQAPNPTIEMLKCQHYYHVYETSSARPNKPLDCSPPMRTPASGNLAQTTITTESGKTLYVNDANL